MTTIDTGYREQLADLVRGARQNDQDKLTALVTELYPIVYKYTLARMGNNTGDMAEDITQETLIKAMSSLNTLSDPGAVRTWVKHIAENKIKDYYRSAPVKNTVNFSALDNTEDELDYDPADERITYQPEMAYNETARQEIVLDVLNTLPEEQRQVVMLKFYENMTIDQISSYLDIPTSTVVGRLQKGKEKVKLRVSEIQTRDGIKLYGMAPLPFFITILRGWRDSDTVSGAARTLTGTAFAVKAAAITAEVSAAGSAAGTAAAAAGSAAGTIAAGSAAAGHTAAGFWTAGRIAGAVVLAGAAAGAVPVYNNFIRPRVEAEPMPVYSALDYAEIYSAGYNGEGTVNIAFHSDDPALQEILSTGTCTVENNGALHNGDVAQAACTFETDPASAGYSLTNTAFNVHVNGLNEYLPVDLFYGVDVVWQMDDEAKTGEVVLVLPENDRLRSHVTYTITDQSEDGTVKVHADPDRGFFHDEGLVIPEDGLDKTYSIGPMPDPYEAEKADCSRQNGEWNEDDHSCTLPEPEPTPEPTPEPQPIAAETMTPQGQAIVNAAYAQLGSTDLCSLVVANALAAIGVDAYDRYPGGGFLLSTETIRVRGYWVDTPQPGDVAYYSSNYSGTSSHVAIYIGNGQVISGNFNGSTQIVPAYIGGQQSQPQYYRYY